MSLEAITQHILSDAHAEVAGIIRKAEAEAKGLIQEAKKEAEALSKEILEKERFHYEREKQRLIVQARLEYKKSILEAKQELIDAVFKKLKSDLESKRFKKEQVLAEKTKEVDEDIDFYLNKIRQEHETEIAKILFL